MECYKLAFGMSPEHGSSVLTSWQRDEEASRAAIAAAVHSAMTFGYRLSLQRHKLVGLP
jgi:organic radical activating enzyme